MQATPDDLLAAGRSVWRRSPAWLSGHGVLASHAADACCGSIPSHPMALRSCSSSAADHASNPAVWGTLTSHPGADREWRRALNQGRLGAQTWSAGARSDAAPTGVP